MTRAAVKCRWCGQEIQPGRLGPVPKYCRRSCRQRAYEMRKLVRLIGHRDGMTVTCASDMAAKDQPAGGAA